MFSDDVITSTGKGASKKLSKRQAVELIYSDLSMLANRAVNQQNFMNVKAVTGLLREA